MLSSSWWEVRADWLCVRHSQGSDVWRAPGYYDFHKFTNTFARATQEELGGHQEFKGTSWAKDTSVQHSSWDVNGHEIDFSKK
eukprot:2898693-Prymnesium_polylepis.2